MPAQSDRKALLLSKKINLEEKQAKLQSKIDRLNEMEEKLARARKILWGAALLDEANRNPTFAAWAVAKASEYFTRQADKNRIASDIAQFKKAPTGEQP